jgi:hypothetical protein
VHTRPDDVPPLETVSGDEETTVSRGVLVVARFESQLWRSISLPTTLLTGIGGTAT